MIGGVLLLTQISGTHKRNSHPIHKNHLDGGVGDGRQIKGAQFSLQRQMHIHIAHSRQRIPLDGSEGDQIGPFGPRTGYQPDELVGGTRLAEEDEEIAMGEDADVAMEGVDGEQKRGSNSEGDEGLGDLVGDKTGLADAGEEDGAGGMEEGAVEGQGLGMINVVEEEVEVVLLGFEEVEKGSLVNGLRELEEAESPFLLCSSREIIRNRFNLQTAKAVALI